MHRISHTLILAAFALSPGVFAADKKTDTTGCDNVNWSKEVLAEFPNAQRGCQRVILRGDVVYAQYKAEVTSSDKEAITVYMKDRDGKNMTKVKLAPSDDMIKVNDKDTKFRDVAKGTELRFYMPHNRWGLYANPEGSPLKVLSSEPM
jgi:hypothetical protein